MFWSKRKVIHEVEMGSNLERLLTCFIATLNDGFTAIAKAIAADYQRQIDELTEQLRASNQSVSDAIKKQSEGE